MAIVNPQSTEEYGDRVVYSFQAASFTQAASTYALIAAPGYKTLVNDATTTEFAIPAQSYAARFFKIEWFFVPSARLYNNILSSYVAGALKVNRIRATTLNYDGKAYQTVFYRDVGDSLIYASSQLRSINITNIELDPIMEIGTYSVYGLPVTVNVYNLDCKLLLLAYPVVTMFRKP